MASHERPHTESSGQLPSEVGDLQAERVEERPVEQYAGILGQWGPVAMEDDKVVRVPTPLPPPPLQVPGGLAL